MRLMETVAEMEADKAAALARLREELEQARCARRRPARRPTGTACGIWIRPCPGASVRAD